MLSTPTNMKSRKISYFKHVSLLSFPVLSARYIGCNCNRTPGPDFHATSLGESAQLEAGKLLEDLSPLGW